ncbi:NACHT domain-containing protein [Actinophytocola sp.]|uniref:NACHT domain-containing protein n=1 Tax=Actinophytocola sp. TaxID=1872138 RepID=UPI003D6C4508
MESAALKLGGAVASHGARSWLQRRRARFERTASLAELAEVELKSPLQRRKLENLVERIGHQVAEQLAPVLGQRFGSLPDNEVSAAIVAVVDVLREADLSDEALLTADADPEELARRLRARFPERARHVSLSERAGALYDLGLDQACRHLVQVIRHLPTFQPAALVEVLGRLSAQSDQLGALLARTPVTSLHAPHGTDHDADFRTEYLRHLASKLDRLELLGMPTVEQPTLALTVAYLSLSVANEAGRGARGPGRPRFEDWFNRLEAPRQAEGVSVEAAIGDTRRTLLRGDAGSGKTTLLNWLAVRAARGELGGALKSWNGCVPFPIRLRSFAVGELPPPEDYVAHAAKTIAGIMPNGWVHRQLRAGTALVLVDGVDEVPARRRRAVRTWLRELVRSFPRIGVVVTSRTAAADHRWLAEERFSSVLLEPMSPSNVVAFVERWHQAAEAAGVSVDVPAAHRRLRGQLERPHLRELATSPLLCAMLCALNLAHRSELPRDRMDLYAKALAMLLHLRDAERGIDSPLGDAEKRVLLRDLAWRLTLANRIELPRADALEHLTRKLSGMPNVDAEPEALLVHLLERSGVLRAPVPGRVDFVHRTFQEYLAADEAIQQHHVDTLVSHAHLDTWWETIVMAAGHATARQAGQLLTGIVDRAEREQVHARQLRLLAAACLETVRDIDPAVHARVDVMIEQRLVPPRNLRETDSLAAVGHRVLRYLPGRLDELSEAKAAATVRAAALTGSTDALRLLATYAQDPRNAVQRELERAWLYFDPERFADEVLVDSPLRHGEFEVRSRRLLPYVSRLRALTSLSVGLVGSDSEIRDLRMLDGVPALTQLSLSCGPHDVDLTPLREHRRLRQVWLYGAGRYTRLRTLAALGALTSLNLHQKRSFTNLEFLAHTAGLAWLALGRADASSLAPIADLPALRDLVLDHYTNRALAYLPTLERVTSLTLFAPVDEGDLSIASERFPRATSLNISAFENFDLGPVTTLPLKKLIVQNSSVDLRPLNRLPTLRSLYVFNPEGSVDLSPLADLKVELRLTRGDDYTGLERLGPNVKIRYW